MNWTKYLLIFGVIYLAGCASQDELIPQDGPEMKDIYRSAIGESRDAAIYGDEAEVVCEHLETDETKDACIEKVGLLLDEMRISIESEIQPEPMDYIEYTRTMENELESLFPRMPNPDLVIYVYPHLATRTRAPIPGYSTAIPLYDRVEYKLPGENLKD